MKHYLIENTELMKDWDYRKNKDLNPASLSFNSNERVNWKCHVCGYEWNTTVANRAGSLKRGCRKCGRIIASKKTSLKKAEKNNIQDRYPHIAKEWHPTKNPGIDPKHISYGSEKKVWWLCPWCKAEWQARINHRTIRGDGCPSCSKSSTSFPEQAIFYYVKKIFNDAINRDTSNGFELDIFIPSRKIGVEYDGTRWHNGKKSLKKDNQKDLLCKENGIILYRIREKKLEPTINSNIISIGDENRNNLENAIERLLLIIGIKNFGKININEDLTDILSLYRRNMRESSLAFKYPDIAKEWHPTKNGNLTPENVASSSGKPVWWKCKKCGYEWPATPNHRTRNRGDGKRSGCPMCSKEYINNFNKVEIINIDTNEIYDSLTEAAKSIGVNKSTLCGHLNGKGKTCRGYHWAYVNSKNRRRKNIKAKIKNIDLNIIFENSKEAAKWCSGDSRAINRCCNGVTATAYGYHWSYVKE